MFSLEMCVCGFFFMGRLSPVKKSRDEVFEIKVSGRMHGHKQTTETLLFP